MSGLFFCPYSFGKAHYIILRVPDTHQLAEGCVSGLVIPSVGPAICIFISKTIIHDTCSLVVIWKCHHHIYARKTLSGWWHERQLSKHLPFFSLGQTQDKNELGNAPVCVPSPFLRVLSSRWTLSLSPTKWGPWTSCIAVAWELIRTVDSQTPARPPAEPAFNIHRHSKGSETQL